MGEQFHSPEEIADVRSELKRAKKGGAESGGVFGSILKGTRRPNSDIDIVINDPKAPHYGEIEHKQGEKSGTWLHIFRKKPGISGGKSKHEQVLDEAEKAHRKLFKKK